MRRVTPLEALDGGGTQYRVEDRVLAEGLVMKLEVVPIPVSDVDAAKIF
jgi:hypothetical protein